MSVEDLPRPPISFSDLIRRTPIYSGRNDIHSVMDSSTFLGTNTTAMTAGDLLRQLPPRTQTGATPNPWEVEPILFDPALYLNTPIPEPLTNQFNNTGNRRPVVRFRRRIHHSNIPTNLWSWEDKLINNTPYKGNSFSWEEANPGYRIISILLLGVVIAKFDIAQKGITQLVYPEGHNPKFYNLMRFFWRNTTDFKVVRYKELTRISNTKHSINIDLKPGSITNLNHQQIKILERDTVKQKSSKVASSIDWASLEEVYHPNTTTAPNIISTSPYYRGLFANTVSNPNSIVNISAI